MVKNREDVSSLSVSGNTIGMAARQYSSDINLLKELVGVLSAMNNAQWLDLSGCTNTVDVYFCFWMTH